jgi:hypothetical protein
LFRDNYIHDNNNGDVLRNVPSPTGTGISLSGDRDNIVIGNRIVRNGAWGILLVPFPDIGNPPPVAHCEGGIQTQTPDGQTECYYDDWGNEVRDNTLDGNGFFGNPSNGDLAELAMPHDPGNCWHGNHHPDGSEPTSDPPAVQQTQGTCGQANSGNSDPALTTQAVCDTAIVGDCPPTAVANYPQPHPYTPPGLPRQKTMPRPCKGVPRNPWCRHRRDPDHDGDFDRPGEH